MNLQDFKKKYELGLDLKGLQDLATLHPDTKCCAKICYEYSDERPTMTAIKMHSLYMTLAFNNVGHFREVWIV